MSLLDILMLLGFSKQNVTVIPNCDGPKGLKNRACQLAKFVHMGLWEYLFIFSGIKTTISSRFSALSLH